MGREGQGLLEMIVAMGIITTGLLSVVTLVSANLNASRQSAERFVASSLAREGVEAARAVRDGNWLSGTEWNDGLAGVGQDRVGTLLLDTATGERRFDFGASAMADDAAKVFIGTGDMNPERGIMSQFFGGTAPADYSSTIYRRLVSLYPICRDSAGVETVIESESASCPPGSAEIGEDVRSTVGWSVKGNSYSVAAEEKLYDWR